jgi:lipopolysaccharide export system protein LptC
MSDTPMPVHAATVRRLIAAGPTRVRPAVSPTWLARRRLLVTWAKLLLPVVALALLSTIALWPELERQTDEARIAIKHLRSVEGNGRLVDVRYQSVDEKGRPYTVTATSASQAGPQRVHLSAPQGDVSLQNGSWLLLQAKQGVYIQHAGQLDLAGNVTLYRDDGTTLRSASASVDLKHGAAASSDTVSAEGPFGTLDATGFTLVDKGGMVQFAGPARLILNNSKQ